MVISVEDLGFKDGATYKDIYKRALEVGLQLCPAEVGPQLRVQYNDQPRGEWLFIGMGPITGSVGDSRLFSVRHGYDDLWLNARYGNSGYFWRGDYRWVFVRSK